MSYTFENELIDTMEREYLYDTTEERSSYVPMAEDGFSIIEDLEAYNEEGYM